MPVLDFPSAHIDDQAVKELPSVAFALLRGEDDPERLSAIAAQDLVLRDFLHVLAVMCWPDDPDEWVRLNHAVTAGELYEVIDRLGDLVGLNGRVALFVANREDEKPIIGAGLDRDWLGHLASGYILRWIVSRWERTETRAAASLTEAAKAVEEWCAANGIHGGKRQHITRNMWPKYRSVSHLWAALQLMQEAGMPPATPDTFMLFCGTAQWLLEQASAIVPIGRRAGDAVLSIADAWTIPESHLTRGVDGAISTRIWDTDPGAHDIRETGAPPFRQPV